ncbi:MAG: DUF3108 domain-containing protein [Rubrivivax sp.]|nr:DUF3108 domain-containing protein [Rubrivivax sp.]
MTAVTLAHLWLAGRWLPDRLGEGAADSLPRRIEVAFVRELAPTPPPPPAAPEPVPRRRPRPLAAPPAPAASAAPATVQAEARPGPGLPPALEWPAEQASEWPTGWPADAGPERAAETPAEAPPQSTAESPSPTPPAVAAAAFEWPPSTRLSYRLTGNYRGPVEGQAQVEWLRAGTRYQVHMEVSIGPFFAPLMSRRVASEGEITADGLRPSRYDEETRIVMRDPRRLVIFLDADRVRLPGGVELPRPAGVQDSASQFVQLTWLFTTRPDLLQPGVAMVLPLALPRRVQDWVYEVQPPEWLSTPAGEVLALHVKPRRDVLRPGDLAAEMWVAPSLQYLPVRIVIRQDEETHVDLVIERLPLQAEPGR